MLHCLNFTDPLLRRSSRRNGARRCSALLLRCPLVRQQGREAQGEE